MIIGSTSLLDIMENEYITLRKLGFASINPPHIMAEMSPRQYLHLFRPLQHPVAIELSNIHV